MIIEYPTAIGEEAEMCGLSGGTATLVNRPLTINAAIFAGEHGCVRLWPSAGIA